MGAIGAYLDQHFCQMGQRIILRLHEVRSDRTTGPHFIFVTGKLANGDWAVLDPGWSGVTPPENFGTLSGHIAGFTCMDGLVRSFTVVSFIAYQSAMPPLLTPQALSGCGACPVELLVTDPLGRRLGYDPATGQDIFEIPGGSYYRDYPILSAGPDDSVEGEPDGIKNFYIPMPTGGPYTITQIGTGAGPYTLTLETLASGVVAQTSSYAGTAAAGVSSANTLMFVIPPQVTGQPTNQLIFEGGEAAFSVAASGPGALYYQWQYDGTNIVGATNTVLVVANVQATNAGYYKVIVSNAGGAIPSAPATLTVLGTGGASLATIPKQTVDELTPLSVTATATDSNVPPAALTFSLGTAPSGMTINPSTGQINWTPAQTQSPSTNTVVVQVIDNGTPPLGATTSFAVVVQEVNVAPVLPVILSQGVDALAQLTVSNTAAELNIHSTVAYQLLNAPAGASIDTNGVITWTPSLAQSPSTNVIMTVATANDPYDSVHPSLSATNSFTVVVQQPNAVPVLPAIGDQTVNELTQLTITDTATESNPNATLSYLLLNPPAGMAINTNTGVITWTPSQAQSPSTVNITVVATSSDPYDPVNPRLSATNGFPVVVQEVNVAPVLPVIANQTVTASTRLTVINTATDSNIHDSLTYNKVNWPAGAAIDANGIITWIPSPAQANSNYGFVTVVTAANNTHPPPPSLYATNSFTVMVNPSQNTFTWTNSSSVGSDWRLAANWSPNGVPGPADNAYIPAIGSGPTVLVYVDTSVSSLTLAGGPAHSPTLGGSASLTVTGALSWQGGTITNVVKSNGGTLSGNCYLDGGQLINTGTLAWDDATLNNGNSSVISNAPGATINLSANGSVTDPYYGGAGATFYNAGQLNVLAGPNGAAIMDTFININTGTVSVISGTLTLLGSGTSEGTITVASNAMLKFNGNGFTTFTFTSGSDLNVAGNLLFTAGTVNLAGVVSVAGTNVFSEAAVNVTGMYPITSPLVISGGTLNLSGTGALTPPMVTMTGGTLTNSAPMVTGELDWSGGTIEGVVQFNGGSLSGLGVILQTGGELINTGTLAWNVDVLVDNIGSIISNAPGAIINLAANPNYLPPGGTSSPGAGTTFYNAGVLNVSAGTNDILISDALINSGNIFVDSGTLSLVRGGTNESTIAVVNPNAKLQFSSPVFPFTCTSGSDLDVAGNLLFAQGTVNLAGTVRVAGTNTITVGTVNVTGDYPITTPLVISGGTLNLSGTGALTPPVMTMSGGVLSNTVPVRTGDLEWVEGTILGVVQCNGGTLGGSNPANGGLLRLEGGQLINTGTLTWNDGLYRRERVRGQQRARRDNQHGHTPPTQVRRGGRHIRQLLGRLHPAASHVLQRRPAQPLAGDQ